MEDFSQLTEALNQPDPEEEKPEVETGLLAGRRGSRSVRVMFILIGIGLLCGAVGAYLIWRAAPDLEVKGVRFGVPGSINDGQRPDGLPADIPLLPGAMLTDSRQSVTNGVSTVLATWTTPQPLNDVDTFFFREMTNAGIELGSPRVRADEIVYDFTYDTGAGSASQLRLRRMATDQTLIELNLIFRP